VPSKATLLQRFQTNHLHFVLIGEKDFKNNFEAFFRQRTYKPDLCLFAPHKFFCRTYSRFEICHLIAQLSFSKIELERKTLELPVLAHLNSPHPSREPIPDTNLPFHSKKKKKYYFFCVFFLIPLLSYLRLLRRDSD
jgi:hypothetical protein